MSEYMYDIGDWIVHIEHGVGQIKDKETKVLGGSKSSLFRVETLSGVYRLPPEHLNTDRVRSLASSEEMDRALNMMQESPQKLPESPRELEKKLLMRGRIYPCVQK